MRVILLAPLVALLTACAASSIKYTDAPYIPGIYSKRVFLAYPGEPRPLADVGIVTQDAILDIIRITKDGEEITRRQFGTKGLYPTGRTQIHLLPGNYGFRFCFHISQPNYWAWCKSNLVRSLQVRAGSVTHLEYAGAGSNQWTVREHDGLQDLPTIEADFTALVLDKQVK